MRAQNCNTIIRYWNANYFYTGYFNTAMAQTPELPNVKGKYQKEQD
jgi:hypothetical protein|tara:strand:- start:3386 stop:3523 length:138 start_codon:yes stop_codon:yes gene_type:complete